MRIRKSVFDTRFAAKLRGTCTDRKVETSQVESDIQNEPIVDSSLLAHQNALLPVRIRHFTMMHAHTVSAARIHTRFRHLTHISPLAGTLNVVVSLLAAA